MGNFAAFIKLGFHVLHSTKLPIRAHFLTLMLKFESMQIAHLSRSISSFFSPFLMFQSGAALWVEPNK